MKRIAIVSVHPDDETLGCGGTILRHAAEGAEISWIVVTSPWEPMFTKATMDVKTREVDRVAAAYGFADVRRLGLPTTRVRDLPAHDLLDALAPAIDAVRPDWLYTIHAGDIHSDHRAVFEALAVICKPFRVHRRIERFLSFETLSSTDAAPAGAGYAPFAPTVFVDVTAHIDRKIAIMAMFESERQEPPLPRSPDAIRALARYRGATIGCEYAEAFALVREIVLPR
jgi:LmbE family N-acetylglucosaminyl deacetylase